MCNEDLIGDLKQPEMRCNQLFIIRIRGVSMTRTKDLQPIRRRENVKMR